MHALNSQSDSPSEFARSFSVCRSERDGEYNFEKEINFTEAAASVYIGNHLGITCSRTVVDAFIRILDSS